MTHIGDDFVVDGVVVSPGQQLGSGKRVYFFVWKGQRFVSKPLTYEDRCRLEKSLKKFVKEQKENEHGRL